MSVVNVHFFALLREKAQKECETLEFEEMSHDALYEKLSKKYQFNLPAEMIQVAVNDEFASMKDQVIAGSKIVFIPPVAGG